MPTVNQEQVKKITELLKNLPDNGVGLNFYSFQKDGQEIIASDMYPPLNHPQAVNFFFFICVHDYGFWYGDDHGYVEPLYGVINGKRAKGSDLLWRAAMRALSQDEECFEPRKLAVINPQDFACKILADDNGPILFPDFETRFQSTRTYGKYFLENSLTSFQITANANKNTEPLSRFLYFVKKIPGYNRDPFEKRNILLAMVLANRPERFLQVDENADWPPIVDYHLMRIGLRLGLVELCEREAKSNQARKWVAQNVESSIRTNIYDVVSDVIKESGKPMSFVDEKFWSGRRYCPEMEAPDCQKCLFNSVCKKRIELFQPVFRTTAY